MLKMFNKILINYRPNELFLLKWINKLFLKVSRIHHYFNIIYNKAFYFCIPILKMLGFSHL